MEPDLALLQTVVASLDRAGIPHMVTGSMASAIHGQPRATRDIDLVIDPDGHTIEMLVANAESLDLSYLHRWAEQLGVTNLFADLWATALGER